MPHKESLEYFKIFYLLGNNTITIQYNFLKNLIKKKFLLHILSIIHAEYLNCTFNLVGILNGLQLTTLICFFRATDLDATRIYKPYLYPEIFFSMYLKLTGQQNIFDTVKQLPLQVCTYFRLNGFQ